MARYWVGGTGTWSDTAHWSTTSGGSGGSAAPTSSDDVYFDASSGGGTCTIAADADMLSFTGTGYTGTLAGSTSPTINIYGGLTFGAGMTVNNTQFGYIYFKAASGSYNITLNGKLTGSTSAELVFNGAGTWVLQDTFAPGRGVLLSKGNLDTNGKTVTVSYFRSTDAYTDGVRSLTLGASSFTAYYTFEIDSATYAITVNSGTSTVNVSRAGINSSYQTVFNGDGKTWYDVSITFDSQNSTEYVLAGASSYRNLSITGYAGKPNILNITSNQTCSGTFTCNGNSAVNRMWVKSGTYGTATTITAASESLSYTDFSDITAAGASSPWTGTSLGNALGNTNITTTTPVTRYWVATSGGSWSATTSWSSSSGGASGSSVPLCHDTVVVDANSISSSGKTITIDMPRIGAGVSFAAVTNSPTISLSPTYSYVHVFGALTMASGLAASGTKSLRFMARSSVNFTTAGWQPPSDIYVYAPSGTITLVGALTTTADFYLENGTFDANDYNVTVGSVDISNSNTRTLTMGTGTWDLTDSGTVWNAGTTTGLTLNEETSTIKLTNNSSSTKTFTGGGQTYYNLWVATQSTGTVTISGANTFNDLKFDAGTFPILTHSVTQTVTTLTGTGTAGNIITLVSSSAGSAATISCASGTARYDYWSIKDSTITGGAFFYANTTCTNVSGNTGWVFLSSGLTNPTYAYADDANYATGYNGDGILSVQVSKDGGSNYSSALTQTFNGSESTKTYGAGSTEKWGLSWTGADITDANFKVKLSIYNVQVYGTFGFTVTAGKALLGVEVAVKGYWTTATQVFSINHLKVKVYYADSSIPLQAGSTSFATDGRKNGEGAGAGTGVMVFYDGTAWRACDTGATVAA